VVYIKRGLDGVATMNNLEVISWVFVLIGFGGICLNIVKSRWCWPVWAITDIGLVAVNWIAGSKSQAIYFAVCIGSCVWGYYVWKKDDRRRREQEQIDSVYTDWSNL
jgi:nicotinamide riboside transporter PnuC